jgi:hypothetical protein
MNTRAMDFKQDLISFGKRTLIEIPIALTLSLLNTFFHESGHATAGYALTSSTPHIYIGSSNNSTALIETPLVTINGFSPFAGYTSYTTTEESAAWRKVIRSFAGPLSGALFLAGFNYLLSKVYKNPTALFQLLVQALYALNVLQLIPTKSGGKSDGYLALEHMGVSQDTLSSVQTYGEIPLAIAGGLAFIAPVFIKNIKLISQRAAGKLE